MSRRVNRYEQECTFSTWHEASTTIEREEADYPGW